MKRISSLLVLVFLSSFLGAQDVDPANYGVVRFMNLVDAGRGNLQMVINGKAPKKDGFRLGQRTGPIPFQKGALKLLLTKEGCLPAERRIEITAETAQTIVMYAEEDFDEAGKSLGWQIKTARLQQHTPKKGLVITFVSFCKKDVLDLEIEEGFSGKLFKQSVYKLKSTRLQIAESGRVRATVNYLGERIGTINVDENGNYIAMIYEDDDGQKKIETFYDPEFIAAGG